MLRFYQEAALSGVSATLTDKSGRETPCRIYQSGDKRVQLETYWATILLLPETPLSGSTEYTVKIQCKLDDTEIEKAWAFKTRPK